jgi:hypothetical protein
LANAVPETMTPNASAGQIAFIVAASCGIPAMLNGSARRRT